MRLVNDKNIRWTFRIHAYFEIPKILEFRVDKLRIGVKFKNVFVGKNSSEGIRSVIKRNKKRILHHRALYFNCCTYRTTLPLLKQNTFLSMNFYAANEIGNRTFRVIKIVNFLIEFYYRNYHLNDILIH